MYSKETSGIVCLISIITLISSPISAFPGKADSIDSLLT